MLVVVVITRCWLRDAGGFRDLVDLDCCPETCRCGTESTTRRITRFSNPLCSTLWCVDWRSNHSRAPLTRPALGLVPTRRGFPPVGHRLPGRRQTWLFQLESHRSRSLSRVHEKVQRAYFAHGRWRLHAQKRFPNLVLRNLSVPDAITDFFCA